MSGPFNILLRLHFESGSRFCDEKISDIKIYLVVFDLALIMGYSWENFLTPSKVNKKEKAKEPVNKEENVNLPKNKEEVKDKAFDDSKKLYNDLLFHISGEHNSTR